MYQEQEHAQEYKIKKKSVRKNINNQSAEKVHWDIHDSFGTTRHGATPGRKKSRGVE